MDNEDNCFNKERIDMIDVIKTLRKRKKTALTVFIFIMLCTLVVLFLSKPQYTTKTTISIGYLFVSDSYQRGAIAEDLIYIEDPNDISRSVKGEFGLRKTNKEQWNILEISAKSDSPKEAREKLSSLIDSMLKKHRDIFNAYISEMGNTLVALKENRANITAQLKDYDNYLKGHANLDKSAEIYLEKGKLLTTQTELDKRITETNLSMMEPYSKMTQVLKPPSAPSKTKTPLLYLLAGGVIAIFLGVYSAFVHEYIVKAKFDLKS